MDVRRTVWGGDVRYTVQHLSVGQLFVLFQRFLESLRNQTNKHSGTRKDHWAQGDTHPEEHATPGTPKRFLVI